MLTQIYVMIPVFFVVALALRVHAERQGRKLNFIEIICLAVLVTLPVGLSEVIYEGENDRYMYVHYFLNVFPEDITMCREPFIHLFPEEGWALLNVIIKYFIANDAKVFIFLVCVVIVFPVVYRFAKDFEQIEIPIVLFVVYGTYLQALNGMRQACATAILVCGYWILVKGNLVQYFLLVVLAASFHVSALIFLVLLPFRYIRIDGWIMRGMVGVSIVGWLMYNPVIRFLCMMFPDNRYIQDYFLWLIGEGGQGANPVRMLWIFLPLIVGFLYREQLESKEEGFRFVFNLSVINLIIMLFATKTWIFARFNFYFSMFEIYLICWELKYIFQRKKYIWGYWGTIGFYSLFMLLSN